MGNTMPGKEKVWKYDGLEQIGGIAGELISYAGDYLIWLFEGEMGAGKTTLIKALCERMGVVDNISSPTYGIVNEYWTEEGGIIYHFDFYRIKTEVEALDIGIEEYFDSGSYCFIEWPSKIPHLLPAKYLKVEIQPVTNNKRQLIVTKNEEA